MVTGAESAVIGAVKGALLGIGAGLLSVGTEFVSGTAGSALGQWIRGGKVDLGKSLMDGVTNAVTGAIYGNKGLKNLGNAFVRGAGAGQPDPPSTIQQIGGTAGAAKRQKPSRVVIDEVAGKCLM